MLRLYLLACCLSGADALHKEKGWEWEVVMVKVRIEVVAAKSEMEDSISVSCLSSENDVFATKNLG